VHGIVFITKSPEVPLSEWLVHRTAQVVWWHGLGLWKIDTAIPRLDKDCWHNIRSLNILYGWWRLRAFSHLFFFSPLPSQQHEQQGLLQPRPRRLWATARRLPPTGRLPAAAAARILSSTGCEYYEVERHARAVTDNMCRDILNNPSSPTKVDIPSNRVAINSSNSLFMSSSRNRLRVVEQADWQLVRSTRHVSLVTILILSLLRSSRGKTIVNFEVQVTDDITFLWSSRCVCVVAQKKCANVSSKNLAFYGFYRTPHSGVHIFL
jgi:hypothetical protein